MDTGFDKQQLEDAKKWVEGVVADATKLRLYVCLLLLAFGWLGVVRPLGQRLAKAQMDLKRSKTGARRAANASHYVKQRKLYEPKLTNRDDIAFWQSYITEKLDASGAVLSSLEPSMSTPKFKFKIIRLMLTARAEHYQDIVDFIDRMEHGELAVRMESVTIDETSEGLLFICMVQCLVKPSLKLPGDKPRATPESEQDEPDAEEQLDQAQERDDEPVAEGESLEPPGGGDDDALTRSEDEHG